MHPPSNKANVQTLLNLRIIWFALLIGPLSFLMIVVFGMIPSTLNVTPQPMFTWICAGMLVIELPIFLAIRASIFRRGRLDGRLMLKSYTIGNIIFWAGCEGVAFFGIVAAMINKKLSPTLPFIVIALAMQALTFPIGSNVLQPGEERS